MFRAMMKAYPESLTLRNSTENTTVTRNLDQDQTIPEPLKGNFRHALTSPRTPEVIFLSGGEPRVNSIPVLHGAETCFARAGNSFSSRTDKPPAPTKNKSRCLKKYTSLSRGWHLPKVSGCSGQVIHYALLNKKTENARLPWEIKEQLFQGGKKL